MSYYQQMANGKEAVTSSCTTLSLSLSPLDSIPHCSKLLPVAIVRKLCEFVMYLYNTLRVRYTMWKAKTSEDVPVHQSNGKCVEGVSKKRAKSRRDQHEKKSQDSITQSRGEQANSSEKDPIEVATASCPEAANSTVVAEKGDATVQPAGSSKLVIEESNSWSQQQQKQLELALSKYSQQPVEQRWMSIADAVPGKSKVHTI